jgi:hypothetical protein
MATISHLTGVSTSGAYLATVTATATQLTITPMPGSTKPVMTANTEPNTIVNPTLKRLLDKAGLEPPPAGKLLAISHVNTRLTEAKLTFEERCEAKAALVRLGMVELGKPVDV